MIKSVFKFFGWCEFYAARGREQLLSAGVDVVPCAGRNINNLDRGESADGDSVACGDGVGQRLDGAFYGFDCRGARELCVVDEGFNEVLFCHNRDNLDLSLRDS